jgi:hypothetical protein
MNCIAAIKRKQLDQFACLRLEKKYVSFGRELVAADWENILEKMLAYKKKHYPDDSRIITLCGYTPWKTFRVEWQ